MQLNAVLDQNNFKRNVEYRPSLHKTQGTHNWFSPNNANQRILIFFPAFFQKRPKW